MSKRIVLSAAERGELVLRLLRKEATAGQLAREAGISEPTLYQRRDAFLKGGFSNLEGRQGTDTERQRLSTALSPSVVLAPAHTQHGTHYHHGNVRTPLVYELMPFDC